MTSLFDIDEKRDAAIEVCECSEHSDYPSSDLEESSDLDEMTSEVVQVNEGIFDIDSRSICSSLFATPVQKPKSGKDQNKNDNNCYYKQDVSPVLSKSSKQASEKFSPLKSPSVAIQFRRLPISNLREIANSNLNLVKNFVKKDVILTKPKNKHHVQIADLEVREGLQSGSSNRNADQKPKLRRIWAKNDIEFCNFPSGHYLNNKASDSLAGISLPTSQMNSEQSTKSYVDHEESLLRNT